MTASIFLACFLGCLFAIISTSLLVMAYQQWRFKRAFARAREAPMMPPDEAAAQLHAAMQAANTLHPSPDMAQAIGVVWVCTQHGRCIGCPEVLAQLDAIARIQGEHQLLPIERDWREHFRRVYAA